MVPYETLFMVVIIMYIVDPACRAYGALLSGFVNDV